MFFFITLYWLHHGKSRHKTQKFCTFSLVKDVNFLEEVYPILVYFRLSKTTFYSPFFFPHFLLFFPSFSLYFHLPLLFLFPSSLTFPISLFLSTPTYLLHSFLLYSHDLSMIKLKIKIRATWQAVLFEKVETKTMV